MTSTSNAARSPAAKATPAEWVTYTLTQLEAMLPPEAEIGALALRHDPRDGALSAEQLAAAEEAIMGPAQSMIDLIDTLRVQDPGAEAFEADDGTPAFAPAPLTYHSFMSKADRPTDVGSLIRAMAETMARSAHYSALRYGDLSSQVRARQAGTNMEIDGEGNRHTPRDGDRDPIAGSDDETTKLIARMQREMVKAHYYGQRALAANAVIESEGGEAVTYRIRQMAAKQDDPAAIAKRAAAAKMLARFTARI